MEDRACWMLDVEKPNRSNVTYRAFNRLKVGVVVKEVVVVVVVGEVDKLVNTYW